MSLPTVTSAVIAPFYEPDSQTNRPSQVAEVLAEFGPVDVYTTAFDHASKVVRPALQPAPLRAVEYVPSPGYRSNVSVQRMISHAWFSAQTAKRFAKRRREYDLIYATAPLAGLATVAFRLGRRSLKVLDVVDVWPDSLPFSERARRSAWPAFRAWRGMFNQAVVSADALMAVSDRFLDTSVPYFRGESADARRFYIAGAPIPTDGVSKEKLLTIAYVGNIGHLYDFDTLISAVADPTVRGQVQVFIVGDGDRRQAVLDQLANRKVPHVYFGSVRESARLGEVLGRCHLGFNGYVNTTAAFSYKATTYLSAGLPLLNSMGGDLQSLVQDRAIGYNYRAGDTSDLLRALQESRVSHAVVTDNAERFFREELSSHIVSQKIYNFMYKIISQNIQYKTSNCHSL